MTDASNTSAPLDTPGTPNTPGAPDALRTIRCGVVGVGRMGRHHARVYTELPGTKLVGVVDADAERRQGICEQHGCLGFETVEQLLAQGVDAVTIATPTTHHLRCAEPLLRAGVACLIEKPLAQDAAEAQRIVDLATETGSVLQVGHIERYNPVMRALRKEQESGSPLIPRFIEIHRVSPMTFRSVDVGVVFDMMIHDIDLVQMLLSTSSTGESIEPVEVQAAGVPMLTEHEDICNARLSFETERGPCVANITASRLAFKTERTMRLVAEDGYVSINHATKTGMLIRKTANAQQLEEVREALRTGQDLSDLDYGSLVAFEQLAIDDAEPLRMQLEDFIDATRNGRRPAVDVHAGFAAVRTAERIVKAVRAAVPSGRF